MGGHEERTSVPKWLHGAARRLRCAAVDGKRRAATAGAGGALRGAAGVRGETVDDVLFVYRNVRQGEFVRAQDHVREPVQVLVASACGCPQGRQ